MQLFNMMHLKGCYFSVLYFYPHSQYFFHVKKNVSFIQPLKLAGCQDEYSSKWCCFIFV